MKILYLSVHEILEYDEITLFSELGHEVFSPGSFIRLENRGDNCLRPDISSFNYNQDIVGQWHKIAQAHPGEDGKDHLTKDFVDNFDCVVVMHLPRYIVRNWNVIKHKRVIWRTIGQSIASTEQQLKPYRDQGMEIVRYSPMEVNIPGFIGQDAMIRFYKDPEEYKGWTGHKERVITLGQSMKQRDQACNFTLFEEVTRPFDRHLFGPGNEDIGDWASGKIPFDQLKQELRDNRVYFYTGTHPASYTLNFIEALMSSIPIVALGMQHGNASYFHNHVLYEVPFLIQHGINGFVSDSVSELQSCIRMLMDDSNLAQSISQEGRKLAIYHFNKDMIREAWRAYFGN